MKLCKGTHYEARRAAPALVCLTSASDLGGTQKPIENNVPDARFAPSAWDGTRPAGVKLSENLGHFDAYCNVRDAFPRR
jgi:hypothetical protein